MHVYIHACRFVIFDCFLQNLIMCIIWFFSRYSSSYKEFHEAYFMGWLNPNAFREIASFRHDKCRHINCGGLERLISTDIMYMCTVVYQWKQQRYKAVRYGELISLVTQDRLNIETHSYLTEYVPLPQALHNEQVLYYAMYNSRSCR